jgi:hypothetical protein
MSSLSPFDQSYLISSISSDKCQRPLRPLARPARADIYRIVLPITSIYSRGDYSCPVVLTEVRRQVPLFPSSGGVGAKTLWVRITHFCQSSLHSMVQHYLLFHRLQHFTLAPVSILLDLQVSLGKLKALVIFK